jgi:hypothetical protein
VAETLGTTAASATESPEALAEAAEPDLQAPAGAPPEPSLGAGEVLAEAAAAGASVLAQEDVEPTSATPAEPLEALEEAIETAPAQPVTTPPPPVSPTGRLSFAQFGSFEETLQAEPRPIEPAPIADDLTLADVGPVEVPPLESALEAPASEGTVTADATEPLAGDVPTAAPTRRRTRAPGRGRRARDHAEAEVAAAGTEGPPA